MSTAISVEGLVKSYRLPWKRSEVLAVKGISFHIEVGEAFGFIGANGAGKSTTIKILTGVSAPTSGTATLFGLPVDQSGARARVGYVPENPSLYDYLSPLEILQMGLRLHGVRVDDVDAHCRQWLERLDLGSVARRTVRSFSKGMVQRVAIAQALSIRPRLLILDEPLSGLDPLGRRDVVETLSEYKKEGGTLFFTSHVLHDVERLADRFGLIHQGQLKAVRSPAELVGEEDSVQVRSFGDAQVAGMSPDFEGRWIGEFPRSGLWEQLELLRKAGHRLLEVRPTLSLESAFMRAVVDKPDGP